MARPDPVAPGILRGGAGLAAVGSLVLAGVLLALPVPQLAADRVEGRVAGPAQQEVPFGPPAAFAWVRVVVFSGRTRMRWTEVAAGPQTLTLQTATGPVEVPVPTSNHWRNAPGLSWRPGDRFRRYTTLDGLALPPLPELDLAHLPPDPRFVVVVTRLDPGSDITIEHPGSEEERLWRASAAAVRSGHRLTTRVAAGMLLVLAVGLGRLARRNT